MVGGREGIRTPDPLLAKQVLSQLSYTPTASTIVDFTAWAAVRKLRKRISCSHSVGGRELRETFPAPFAMAVSNRAGLVYTILGAGNGMMYFPL